MVRLNCAGLPCDHHHEVHDVPDISQIGARVEDKAQGEDFKAHFNTEYREEIRLGGAQLHCQLRLVSVGLMLLQGHHYTGGDDGGEDGPLKGRPLDDEEGEPPEDVGLAQQEERGGARLGESSPSHDRPRLTGV